MIVVHPAEAKDIRLTQQLNFPGEVIQDASDGDIGGTISIKDAAGRVISTRPLRAGPGDRALECQPEDIDCEEGEPGGTYVTFHRGVAFFGDGVGSAECEWTVSDNGHSVTIRITGLDVGVFHIVDKAMWQGDLEYSGTTNVSVEETDAFSDDFWGYGTVTSQDSGALLPTIGFCADLGDPNTQEDPSCDIPPYMVETTNFEIEW